MESRQARHAGLPSPPGRRSSTYNHTSSSTRIFITDALGYAVGITMCCNTNMNWHWSTHSDWFYSGTTDVLTLAWHLMQYLLDLLLFLRTCIASLLEDFRCLFTWGLSLPLLLGNPLWCYLPSISSLTLTKLRVPTKESFTTFSNPLNFFISFAIMVQSPLNWLS